MIMIYVYLQIKTGWYSASIDEFINIIKSLA